VNTFPGLTTKIDSLKNITGDKRSSLFYLTVGDTEGEIYYVGTSTFQMFIQSLLRSNGKNVFKFHFGSTICFHFHFNFVQ
jgi:hypothetical protein